MAIFQELKLGWDGKTYVIPPDRVLGAIAEIEERVTFHEILQKMAMGRPPIVPVASAYGAVLRYAGAEVTDDAVYEGMFAGGKTVTAHVTAAVNHLLLIMTPPSAVQAANAELAAAAKKAQAAPKPSKRSTKRRSARAAG
jgi:hypothetical protein